MVWLQGTHTQVVWAQVTAVKAHQAWGALGEVRQMCWYRGHLLVPHCPITLCCPQTTMPGMKRDCGGAAAILGAFRAAIKQVRRVHVWGHSLQVPPGCSWACSAGGAQHPEPWPQSSFLHGVTGQPWLQGQDPEIWVSSMKPEALRKFVLKDEGARGLSRARACPLANFLRPAGPEGKAASSL